MRNILIPVGMILGTVALIGVGSARADPPPPMTYMSQTAMPVIACDTRPQLDEVIASIKEGKLKEKMAALQLVKDVHNEPICIFSYLNGVVFGEAEPVGVLHADNLDINSWVVHAGNRQGEFYVLYGEVIDQSTL